MTEPGTLSQKLKSEGMICPGESHPISRSVHYARLAAFYPACRNCSLRHETGHLSKEILEKIEETTRRVEREDFFSEEGLRGVYLNEINRSYATQAASAFASLIWESRPRKGQSDQLGQSRFKTSSPKIVVGRDSRPSSPDIYSGVISGLKKSGCEIIDISISTSPCMRFTLHQQEASAGVFVTGEGAPPSWTGMDFLISDPIAQAKVYSLDKLNDRMKHPANRPTRDAGRHRHYQVDLPYETGLGKYFHALRPLKIMIGCQNQLIHNTLTRLFESLPCELEFVTLPCRKRKITDTDDPDIQSIVDQIRNGQYDLGLIIDDDGMKCAFLDDLGQMVPQDVILVLLSDLILAEFPECSVVLEEKTFETMGSFKKRLSVPPVSGGKTHSELAQAMWENDSVLGRGTEGRFWFKDAYPCCDAILTLARMLEVLSRDDIPFSRLSVQVKESLLK